MSKSIQETITDSAGGVWNATIEYDENGILEVYDHQDSCLDPVDMAPGELDRIMKIINN